MKRIKNKKFDCVEMMHKGAECVRERLAGMSEEEQLEYWHKRHQELIERKEKLSKLRKAS